MDNDFLGNRPKEPTPEQIQQAADRIIGRQYPPATEEFEAAFKKLFNQNQEFAVKLHVKYVLDSVPPSLSTLENNLRGYLAGLGFKVHGITVRTGDHA